MTPTPNPQPPDPAVESRSRRERQEARKRRRSLRRWRLTKWSVRTLIGLPLLLIITALVLMRSPMIGRMVREQIMQASGAQLEASRIYIGIDGRLVIDNAVLRVPQIIGDAGRIVRAKRLVVDLDWSAWRSSRIEPRAVLAYEPIFCISQSVDNESVNLSSLSANIPPQPNADAVIGAIGRPVRVDILNGQVEFAEHSLHNNSFQVHHAIQVAGSMEPVEAKKGEYRIKMQEIGRAAADGNRGMILDGRIDLASNLYSLKLLNIPLDSFPPETLPPTYRQIWRSLNVQGRVSEAAFDYDKPNGVQVAIKLLDVRLNVPLPAEPDPANPSETNQSAPDSQSPGMAISGVSGDIGLTRSGLSADLTGILAGQVEPSRVRLTTRGLSVIAGLRCEIVGRGLSVDKNPEFFPYVPQRVREYFAYFSGPTAKFDARVVITRNDPADDQPGEIKIADGRLVLREGQAAFHLFPYPFSDMSGTVEFDENHLRFVDVRGRGPTGAQMTAEAYVSPLNDESEVSVKVRVQQAPLDHHLLDAMPADDRRVVESIFNADRYEQIRAAGLLVSSIEHARVLDDLTLLNRFLDQAQNQTSSTPADEERRLKLIAGLQDSISRLHKQSTLPIFDLGGNARIDVDVHSPPGANSPWNINVNIGFDQAGLLPGPFAYPILARNLTFKLTPDSAELQHGEFIGLTGGSAAMTAKVLLRDRGRRCVRPNIEIHAEKIPVDDLLLFSIPDELSPRSSPQLEDPTRTDHPLSAQHICRKLGIQGVIDVHASILPADHPPLNTPTDAPPTPPAPPSPDAHTDNITFNVQVKLDGLTAQSHADLTPPGLDPPGLNPSGSPKPIIALTDLHGSLNVSPQRIDLTDLHAKLQLLNPLPTPDPALPASTPENLAELDLSIRAGLLGDQESPAGALRVKCNAKDLKLDAPIEHLIEVFSDTTGRFMHNARNDFQPQGRVDVVLDLDHHPLPGAAEPNQMSRTHRLRFTNIRDAELNLEPAHAAQILNPDTVALDHSVSAPTESWGRIRLNSQRGEIDLVEHNQQLRISAREFLAHVDYNDQPAGLLSAQGGFGIYIEPFRILAPANFSAGLLNADFGSPLSHRLMRTALGMETYQSVARLQPEGAYQVELAISPVAPESVEARIDALLEPIDLFIINNNQRRPVSELSGLLHLHAAQRQDSGDWHAAGRIDQITLSALDLHTRINGDWTYSYAAGFALDASAYLHASTLTPDHRDLMPAEVREALAALDVKIDGRWSLAPANLRLIRQTNPSASSTESRPFTHFDATLNFQDGSADIGVPITDARGTINIAVDDDAANTHASTRQFEINIKNVGLKAYGVDLDNVRALIATSPHAQHPTLTAPITDRIDIPYVVAGALGGRLWGKGSITFDTPHPLSPDSAPAAPDDSTNPPTTRRAFYRTDLVASGVAFKSMIEQLAAADTTELPVTAQQSPDDHPIDLSRGVMDASLSLAGHVGDPSSRIGRGAIRVASGQVLNLPIVMQLMQLSNLALPSGDQLDYLQANFYLSGSTANFDQVALLSDSISLLGSGTVAFPAGDLDFTFNSRGNDRIPLLSDLYEALRNEIATTRISGTFLDPHITSQPFVGTRKFLDRLFNTDSPESGPISSSTFKQVQTERKRFIQSPQTGIPASPASSAQQHP